MKLQELIESLKVGLNEHSTLSSKLTGTTMLIEEIKKEIEVTDSNYVQYINNVITYSCIRTYVVILHTYIHT